MTAAIAVADGTTLPSVYPPGMTWDLDIPRVDLCHYLDEALIKFSDHPCLNFLGKKLTYAETGRLIGKAVKGLQDMGVKPGDRVGLHMANTPYYPIMFFAILQAGATVVNFSPAYTDHEMRQQIKDSGVRIMATIDLNTREEPVIGPGGKKHLRKVAALYGLDEKLLDDGMLDRIIFCPMDKMMPTLKGLGFQVIKRDSIAHIDHEHADRVISFQSLVHNDGIYKSVTNHPDDIAVLQYTSGSSDTPKGALLSHFNLVANSAQIQEVFFNRAGRAISGNMLEEGKEKVLAVLPYYHVFAMMVTMISSLQAGAELLILPSPYDIKAIMSTVHKEKPGLVAVVPKLLQAIATHPDTGKYNWSSLRNVISGGAGLPSAVAGAFEKAIGKSGLIRQGYGLSEFSPVLSCQPPHVVTDPASVGLPFPRVEIRISDPDNPEKILTLGEEGEIVARGPNMMQGYHNRPADTAQSMTADGWFRTGDKGLLNSRYELLITGKIKREINYNGIKFSPEQVEEAISRHPSVAECVVVRVPDKSTGEAAKAFIRFHADAAKPSEKEMRVFLEEFLARVKIPRDFEYVTEELPKLGVGKPDWKLLQERERQKFQSSPQPVKPESPHP